MMCSPLTAGNLLHSPLCCGAREPWLSPCQRPSPWLGTLTPLCSSRACSPDKYSTKYEQPIFSCHSDLFPKTLECAFCQVLCAYPQGSGTYRAPLTVSGGFFPDVRVYP